MKDLLERIKNNNQDLKLSEIEGLLNLLLTTTPITNQELVTLSGIPKETLRQFKKTISDLLEKTDENILALSAKGQEELKKIDPKPYKWTIYSSDIEGQRELGKIVEIKNKYDINPQRQYDQFLATAESCFSKAKVVEEKGVLEGKSIALLGDDDLVSVTLGILSLNFKNITVFDIDPSVLSSVKIASEKLGLKNVDAVLYDVRKELHKKYLGKFDVVIFDPPYTKSGVTIFLERAVELLGNVSGFEGKYIFMNFGNSFKSPEKILKVQEIINRFGLVIEDKIEKFARYTGAESIGNASSLYILKANKFTHTIDINFERESFYTYGKEKEEKFPFVDHVVLKVYGVERGLLISKGRLMGAMEKFCRFHRLKVVEKTATVFSGGGMTVTFVLANSNLVAHSWPELSALHIDLITCSPIYKKETLASSVTEIFGTRKVETFYLE